jgi:exosortase H (IPTLxxWG-CTERM-specific)
LFDSRSGFSVSIEAGCNGVEATIVLVAAMMAFPAGWRMKLLGIVIGFLAIQFMNLLRIISLYYLGQWNMQAFEWAHLYIWQSLIILDVLVVFLIWLRFISKEKTLGVTT